MQKNRVFKLIKCMMKTPFNIFIIIITIIFFTKCSDDSDYIDSDDIEPTQLIGTWATMSMDTLHFISNDYLEFKHSDVPERIECNYELIKDTIILRAINRSDNYLKDVDFGIELKDINFLIIYGLFPKIGNESYIPDCNGYFYRVF